GPTALCEAFLEACGSLGVEIKVKLIIFKLFEKYVLADLDQLYAEANQVLVVAGVLPELKTTPARRNPSRAPAAARSGAEAPQVAQGDYADEGVQEVFSALQELLSQARGSVVP